MANAAPESQVRTRARARAGVYADIGTPAASQARSGGARPPLFERHPADGWVLARPYPMRRGTLRALRGLIVHMLPPAPAPRSDEMLARVEEQVRVHMVYMPRIVALGLCIALVFLEWSARLMFKSTRRLSKMSPDQANLILHRLSQSRLSLIATMMLGVRATIMSAFWDQDASHRMLGYDPKPFLAERVGLRLKLIEDHPEVSRVRARDAEDSGSKVATTSPETLAEVASAVL